MFLAFHTTVTRDIQLYWSSLKTVEITPIAERLAVELSLPAFITEFCRGLDSNTKHSTCGANAPTHSEIAVVIYNWYVRVQNLQIYRV